MLTAVPPRVKHGRMPGGTHQRSRRAALARVSGVVVGGSAVMMALLIGAAMIIGLGANPLEGYKELLIGAFGGTEELAESAAKAMPLLLVGTGICVAFRAKVINIGGEGQIIAGGLLSAITALAVPDLPSVVLIPLVLLMGLAGGAIWGGIPGALKAYLGVNEILTTIMLNLVAVKLFDYMVRAPLMDPRQIELGTRIPQTKRLSENADLPVLIAGTRFHLGVVVALLAAGVTWFFLWYTTTGYRVRAVGASAPASRYAGMPVKRMTMLALTISGALCGLAGAALAFGSETHRLNAEGFATGFTGSAGFNGIVAALFGGLHPLFTIPSAFLFGGLLVGANAMQRAIQIPVDLVIGLNGLIVVFVVSSNSLRERLSLFASITGEAAAHEDAIEHEAVSDDRAPPDPDTADASISGDNPTSTDLESGP